MSNSQNGNEQGRKAELPVIAAIFTWYRHDHFFFKRLINSNHMTTPHSLVIQWARS